ncbi:MAG: CysO-cysteine peptidase, partial [uncultured Pseudonocardia sp.]
CVGTRSARTLTTCCASGPTSSTRSSRTPAATTPTRPAASSPAPRGRTARSASSPCSTPRARPRSTSSTPATCCGSTATWIPAARCPWWSTTRTPPPRPTPRAPTSGWRRSRTRTTCWCPPGSRTATSSGRSASWTARSPRKTSRSSRVTCSRTPARTTSPTTP